MSQTGFIGGEIHDLDLITKVIHRVQAGLIGESYHELDDVATEIFDFMVLYLAYQRAIMERNGQVSSSSGIVIMHGGTTPNHTKQRFTAFITVATSSVSMWSRAGSFDLVLDVTICSFRCGVYVSYLLLCRDIAMDTTLSDSFVSSSGHQGIFLRCWAEAGFPRLQVMIPASSQYLTSYHKDTTYYT